MRSTKLWSWSWVALAVGVAFGVCVYAASHKIIAAQWQTTALVRVGQVPGQSRGELSLLASLDEVEEFIRIAHAAIPDGGALRIRRVSDAMIEVRVSASTAQSTQRVHSILIADLFNAHGKLYSERTAFWLSKLERVEAAIEMETKSYSNISSMCSGRGSINGEEGFKCAVLFMVQSENANRRLDLEEERRLIGYDMQSSFTYPTGLIGGAITSKEKISEFINIIFGFLSSICFFVLSFLCLKFFVARDRSAAKQSA